MHCPIIHIVKRFGRVGGMESYVWHLTHGLAARGIEVVVVCEQIDEPPTGDVCIIRVRASRERPRWKSMMSFRVRVDQKIREVFSGQAVLIHSHERSLSHQVTTFHGPPIDPPRGFGWFSRFNRRITSWQQMERDELLGPNVEMILPVSSWIREKLTNRYPKLADKRIHLAWPGVSIPVVDQDLATAIDPNSARFLFVGKEWRRKGLDIAVRIVDEFRRSHPAASLTVFGADQTTVPRSIRSLSWINFQGWSSSIPWLDYDLLLHPARKEPFGMVVIEARSHGIPVVMSSQVGARDLNLSGTRSLELTAPTIDWSQAAAELIQTTKRESDLKWRWSDLVSMHVETIYPQVVAVTL